MADDEIAAGAIDKPSNGSMPRPLKRWRVLVVGGASALVREPPTDHLAALIRDRRLKASERPEPKAAPGD